MKKVIGIVGSYRKGRVIDSAVSEVLRGVESRGAQVSKIYLIDKNIEFCDNCRSCMQTEGDARGNCVHDDDMDEILNDIESADAVVIGAPMNLGSVTAVTKRFIERLGVYAYWPWGKPAPKFRKTNGKKAVIITSSAMPSLMGKIIAGSCMRTLKYSAKVLGAKITATLWFGMVARHPADGLNEKKLKKAFAAGQKLV